MALSQKIHYKDEHVMSVHEYTSQLQKIFHLYYLAGETISEGLNMADLEIDTVELSSTFNPSRNHATFRPSEIVSPAK